MLLEKDNETLKFFVQEKYLITW